MPLLLCTPTHSHVVQITDKLGVKALNPSELRHQLVCQVLAWSGQISRGQMLLSPVVCVSVARKPGSTVRCRGGWGQWLGLLCVCGTKGLDY